MAVTKFPCPACQAVLQLSQTPPPGARIRCPKCQNVFLVKAAPTPVGAGIGAPRGGGSSGQLQRPAVGRSSARMQAPAVGGSAGRMQAPSQRPPSRAAMPPPEEDYDDEEPARGRNRRPRKKASTTNLGLILGLIGGAAVLVIGVIIFIIFWGAGKGNDEFDNSPEALERRRKMLGITFPSDRPGGSPPAASRPRATRPQPTQPKNDDGDSSADKAPGNGSNSAADKAPADSGNAAASRAAPTVAFDPNANPFDGLKFGNLPAKAPRQLAGLKYLPAGSDMVYGMDLEPALEMPQLAGFLRRMMDQSAQSGPDSPPAKLFKALDGNPVVEMAQGAKLGKLAAGMNPQKAGAAIDFSTTVVRLKNPVDRAAVARALLAEAIPALDGFQCHSVPAAEVGGVKFNFFLSFPENDDNTVILSQSQSAELDPLIRRGGELAPALNAALDSVEPSHVWMAMSMEPVKPMLGMLGLVAGNAPPEVQALLKELPKAQGVILQVRLQDNQAKLAFGLTFPTEGQTLGFANSLKDAWTKVAQPQMAAMASQGGATLQDLLKNVKIGQRSRAALASSSVGVAALKDDYPQLAGMMANLGNVAGAMPGGPPAGMDNKPADSGSMASSSGKKSKSNPNAPYGTKEGQRGPEIVGKDLDGKPMKLSDHKGKVVLLDFWAYWCGPCVAMFPHNKELLIKHKGRPFVILGVNEDRSAGDIEQGNAKHKLTWPSFVDGTAEGAPSKIVRQYGIRAFPTMMLLDGNGVIRKIIVGSGPQNTALLDKTIAELLAEIE